MGFSKFFSADQQQEIIRGYEAKPGDLILVIAGDDLWPSVTVQVGNCRGTVSDQVSADVVLLLAISRKIVRPFALTRKPNLLEFRPIMTHL